MAVFLSLSEMIEATEFPKLLCVIQRVRVEEVSFIIIFLGGGSDQKVTLSLHRQLVWGIFFFLFVSYQTGEGLDTGPPGRISLSLQITPNKPFITPEITQVLRLLLLPDPPLAHFISHGLASWPLSLISRITWPSATSSSRPRLVSGFFRQVTQSLRAPLCCLGSVAAPGVALPPDLQAENLSLAPGLLSKLRSGLECFRSQ